MHIGRQNEEGTCYYLHGYAEQLARLNRLSEITRVPKAAHIREGIDIVLKKYEKQLKGRTKKRERR